MSLSYYKTGENPLVSIWETTKPVTIADVL